MSEWVRDTPWRQGHALPAEALTSLGLASADSHNDDVAVVISHDCDLANGPDQEPHVEIMVGRRIGKADGNFTHAKNARKLHLIFQGDGGPVTVELLAAKKVLCSKESLAGHQPRSDLRLDPQNLSVLQRWLAARYRRAAFPDEFDRRFDESGLRDQLRKILERTGSFIPAVFFDVDNGEEVTRNGPDDPYTLDVWILYTTENDPEQARTEVEQAAKDFALAFKKKLYTDGKGWRQIELRSCQAISDEALTYKQSTLLKQWRLEHISLRKMHNQPMLKE